MPRSEDERPSGSSPVPVSPAPARIHDDRQLPALTGLRFFAAMTVLLSHFANRGLVLIPAGAVAFVDGGRTAVSLFFVLSGFILAYNYSRLTGASERRSFYVNRIARIYPVVILSLAIGAVGVAYAVGVHARNPSPLLDWYALTNVDLRALGASFVSQITVTTGWFPTARINQPWNSPAWSIACEMFFYLLFPWLIVRLRRLGTRAMVVVLVAAYAAQILFVAVVTPHAPEGQRGFLISQFPVTHLFDFVIGMATAILYLRGGREWMTVGRRRLLAITVACLGIAVLSATMPVRPAYLPLTPFFALLILGLSVPPRRGRSWLGAGPLLLLGEASFSLYLIHVPLMNLMSIVRLPVWAGWIGVVLTIGASILVFRFYETPGRRLVKRLLTRAGRPRKPDDGRAAGVPAVMMEGTASPGAAAKRGQHDH